MESGVFACSPVVPHWEPPSQEPRLPAQEPLVVLCTGLDHQSRKGPLDALGLSLRSVAMVRRRGRRAHGARLTTWDSRVPVNGWLSGSLPQGSPSLGRSVGGAEAGSGLRAAPPTTAPVGAPHPQVTAHAGPPSGKAQPRSAHSQLPAHDLTHFPTGMRPTAREDQLGPGLIQRPPGLGAPSGIGSGRREEQEAGQGQGHGGEGPLGLAPGCRSPGLRPPSANTLPVLGRGTPGAARGLPARGLW